MLPKCLLLLLVSSFIEADYSQPSYLSPIKQTCLYPKLEHGRVRVRQRSGLVKFTCALRYELVGNRYAICRNGQWDVPLPVCVRPGCEELPVSQNSVQINEHHGAWVVTFCLPGHKLIGSSTVYCDGYNWNGTAPKCADVTTLASLSCDFEDPAICGWTQDELHDFDWRRWNKKTPSAFLFTGPSYDHTYGQNKMGYYMYIESTSRMENHTARLLSPVYDSSLAANGCFVFYYHMYGRELGGLRVYQKPDSVQLVTMLSDETDRQKYLLFEKWGDQGDVWYKAAPQLMQLDEDFQIVIEGIRGASFTSDIAIDDVAIIQGDNCTMIRQTLVTPASHPLSCAGRCYSYAAPNEQCACYPGCLIEMNCCNDFIDVCINSGTTDDDDDSNFSGLPQTQKLVSETTTPKPYSASNTDLFTKPTSTTPKTTAKTTVTTTKKLTTQPISTTTQQLPTTTQNIPTTTEKVSTTTAKATTKYLSTTRKASTTTSKIPTTTKNIPTTRKIPTTTQKKPTTTQKKPTTTQKVSTTEKVSTTQKVQTTTKSTSTVKTTTDYIEIEIMKEEKENKFQKMTTEAKIGKPGNTTTWKTALIIIMALAMCVCLIYVVVFARTARGRQAISRLRGRTSHDSEVRYLNSNSDDDL